MQREAVDERVLDEELVALDLDGRADARQAAQEQREARDVAQAGATLLPVLGRRARRRVEPAAEQHDAAQEEPEGQHAQEEEQCVLQPQRRERRGRHDEQDAGDHELGGGAQHGRFAPGHDGLQVQLGVQAEEGERAPEADEEPDEEHVEHAALEPAVAEDAADGGGPLARVVGALGGHLRDLVPRKPVLEDPVEPVLVAEVVEPLDVALARRVERPPHGHVSRGFDVGARAVEGADGHGVCVEDGLEVEESAVHDPLAVELEWQAGDGGRAAGGQ